MPDWTHDKERETAPVEAAEAEPQPTKAAILTYTTSDRMEMTVELEHTSTHTLAPSYEEIMEAIAAQKVVAGIDENAVRSLCNPPRYNVQITVARGKPAKVGADGYLRFLVDTDRKLQPKERPDGTVDFRDLNFIQNVGKGQPLCEIHAPEKGEDGVDIFGNILEGSFGKKPSDPTGKNTEKNPDGTLLLASCDGSVEVKGGRATVIDLLRINGNIDNSTGDVNFIGDIAIGGDVVSGFRVTSQTGSITIKGNVEGASVEAAGDITVNGGINGMERGSVKAGGSVRCKYIQSCFVKSGKDIYAESIMYCTMECGGNLEMKGERSRLVAGRATIAGHLVVGSIGTSSHVPTTVIINSGAELEKEIREREARLKEMEREELTFRQLFARMEDLHQKSRLTADMLPKLELARNSYMALLENRRMITERLAEAREEQLRLQTGARDSYIQCRGSIHTGVTICFGPLVMQVRQSFINSRLAIVDGEIAILAL